MRKEKKKEEEDGDKENGNRGEGESKNANALSLDSICYERNSQKLGSSSEAVKNYRSVSLLVCKQSLLMLSSNGKAKARVASAGVVKSRVARGR